MTSEHGSRSSLEPRELADLRVRRSVLCRRCSYDLRGLRLDRKCPECGLDAWLTILHLIDPAASKLPRIRNPRRVGAGLVWLMSAAFLFVLLLCVQVMLIQLQGAGLVRNGGIVRFIVFEVPLLGMILALAALWSPIAFKPAERLEADRPVVKPVRVLSWSISAMALISMLYWICQRMQLELGTMPQDNEGIMIRALFHALMAMIAIAGLRSLGSVIDLIGQRSREYRQARGGRQGIEPMVAASVGIIVGSVFRLVGLTIEPFAVMATLGHVVSWVSMLMVLIGLAYLLVNAWWIRRSLRKPPPVLERLVEPNSHGPSGGVNPEPPSTSG